MESCLQAAALAATKPYLFVQRRRHAYGADMHMEKQEQYDLLQKLLLEAEWKGVQLWIFPMDTLGAIHSSSLPSLVALGLTQAAAT